MLGGVKKRCVQFVVKSAIGRFIKEVSKKHLAEPTVTRNGLTFELHNLEINEEVVNAEVLRQSPQIRLVSGSIGSLRGSIPWSLQNPRNLEIEGIDLTFDVIGDLRPQTAGETNSGVGAGAGGGLQQRQPCLYSSMLAGDLTEEILQKELLSRVADGGDASAPAANDAGASIDEGVEMLSNVIKGLVHNTCGVATEITLRFRFPPPGKEILPKRPLPEGTIELLVHLPTINVIDETDVAKCVGNSFRKRVTFSGLIVQLYDACDSVVTVDERNAVQRLSMENTVINGDLHSVQNEIVVQFFDVARDSPAARWRIDLSVGQLHAIFTPSQLARLMVVLSVLERAPPAHVAGTDQQQQGQQPSPSAAGSSVATPVSVADGAAGAFVAAPGAAAQHQQQQHRHVDPAAAVAAVPLPPPSSTKVDVASLSITLLRSDVPSAVRDCWRALRDGQDDFQRSLTTAYYSLAIEHARVVVATPIDRKSLPDPSDEFYSVFEKYGGRRMTVALWSLVVSEQQPGRARAPLFRFVRAAQQASAAAGASPAGGGGVPSQRKKDEYRLEVTTRTTCPVSPALARECGLMRLRDSTRSVVRQTVDVFAHAVMEVQADVLVLDRLLSFARNIGDLYTAATTPSLSTPGDDEEVSSTNGNAPNAAGGDAVLLSLYSADSVDGLFADLDNMRDITDDDLTEDRAAVASSTASPVPPQPPVSQNRFLPADPRAIAAAQQQRQQQQQRALQQLPQLRPLYDTYRSITIDASHVELEVSFPLSRRPAVDIYGPLTQRLFDTLRASGARSGATGEDANPLLSGHLCKVLVFDASNFVMAFPHGDTSSIDISLSHVSLSLRDTITQERTMLGDVQFAGEPGVPSIAIALKPQSDVPAPVLAARDHFRPGDSDRATLHKEGTLFGEAQTSVAVRIQSVAVRMFQDELLLLLFMCNEVLECVNAALEQNLAAHERRAEAVAMAVAEAATEGRAAARGGRAGQGGATSSAVPLPSTRSDARAGGGADNLLVGVEVRGAATGAAATAAVGRASAEPQLASAAGGGELGVSAAVGASSTATAHTFYSAMSYSGPAFRDTSRSASVGVAGQPSMPAHPTEHRGNTPQPPGVGVDGGGGGGNIGVPHLAGGSSATSMAGGASTPKYSTSAIDIAIGEVLVKLRASRLSVDGLAVGEPLWMLLPAAERRRINRDWAFHTYEIKAKTLDVFVFNLTDAALVTTSLINVRGDTLDLFEIMPELPRFDSSVFVAPTSLGAVPEWTSATPLLQGYAVLHSRSNDPRAAPGQYPQQQQQHAHGHQQQQYHQQQFGWNTAQQHQQGGQQQQQQRSSGNEPRRVVRACIQRITDPEAKTQHMAVDVQLDRVSVTHQAAHPGDHWLFALMAFFSDAPVVGSNGGHTAPHDSNNNNAAAVAGGLGDSFGGDSSTATDFVAPYSCVTTVTCRALDVLLQYQPFGRKHRVVALAPRVTVNTGQIVSSSPRMVLRVAFTDRISLFLHNEFPLELLRYDADRGMSSAFGMTRGGIAEDLQLIGFVPILSIDNSLGDSGDPIIVRVADVPNKPIVVEVSNLTAELTCAWDSFNLFQLVASHFLGGHDMAFLPSPFAFVASNGAHCLRVHPPRVTATGPRVRICVPDYASRVSRILSGVFLGDAASTAHSQAANDEPLGDDWDEVTTQPAPHLLRGAATRAGGAVGGAGCSAGGSFAARPAAAGAAGSASCGDQPSLRASFAGSSSGRASGSAAGSASSGGGGVGAAGSGSSPLQMVPAGRRRLRLTSGGDADGFVDVSIEAPAGPQVGWTIHSDQNSNNPRPHHQAAATGAPPTFFQQNTAAPPFTDLSSLFTESRHFSIFSPAAVAAAGSNARGSTRIVPLDGYPPVAVEILVHDVDCTVRFFGGTDFGMQVNQDYDTMRNFHDSFRHNVTIEGRRVVRESRELKAAIVGRFRGVHLQIDSFVENHDKSMLMLLTIRDFDVVDRVVASPVRSLLSCTLPRECRDTDSSMLEMKWVTVCPRIGGLRPQPEEQVSIRAQPLWLSLHEQTLNVLTPFFIPVDIASEPSTLYFNKLFVHPLDLAVSWYPADVDLSRLGRLEMVELLRVVSIEGARMKLSGVLVHNSHVDQVVADLLEAVLPQLKPNLLLLLCGLAPIRSLTEVAGAVSDLVLTPLASLRRSRSLYSGVVKGLSAFSRRLAGEAFSVTSATTNVLHSTVHRLARPVQPAQHREPLNRGDQPVGINDGVQRGAQAVTTGLAGIGESVTVCIGDEGSLVQLPLVALVPIDGALRGLTEVLRGLRNFVRPDSRAHEEKQFKRHPQSDHDA